MIHDMMHCIHINIYIYIHILCIYIYTYHRYWYVPNAISPQIAGAGEFDLGLRIRPRFASRSSDLSRISAEEVQKLCHPRKYVWICMDQMVHMYNVMSVYIYIIIYSYFYIVMYIHVIMSMYIHNHIYIYIDIYTYVIYMMVSDISCIAALWHFFLVHSKLKLLCYWGLVGKIHGFSHWPPRFALQRLGSRWRFPTFWA